MLGGGDGGGGGVLGAKGDKGVCVLGGKGGSKGGGKGGGGVLGGGDKLYENGIIVGGGVWLAAVGEYVSFCASLSVIERVLRLSFVALGVLLLSTVRFLLVPAPC